MLEKLDKYELDLDLSKRLYALMQILKETLKLDYEYSFKLLDKDKLDFLMDDELEKYQGTIDDEKWKVTLIRHFRTDIFLELLKKPDFSLEKIDQFIAYYKELLAS